MEIAKRVRLAEVWRRMASAPAAQSYEEVRMQFADILNAVEDELTEIPYDPEKWRTDGRMYPPGDDNLRPVEGHAQVFRFRSVAHNTYMGQNGAIEVARLDGTVEFSKTGSDGRGVWELK